MHREFAGSLDGAGMRVAIVVSRFNDFITARLLDGALDMLVRHNVAPTDCAVVRVPGAFEIPIVAKKLASMDFDAVICLGAVIRGSTPHFEHVASQVSRGVAQVALDAGKPVIFGVLTTDTIEQAVERAGTKSGNRGADAALAAIEMVNLTRMINGKAEIAEDGAGGPVSG